jgi:hypothetical protein
MTWRRTLSSGAVLSLLAMRPAAPQVASHEPGRWDRPEIGLTLAVGLGRGQFQQFVQAAGGLGAYGTLPIAPHGALALRADVSVLFHAFESWSGTPAFNTESYITSLRAGPQLALPLGRVQLYGFWAGGFSYFATDANPDDACGCAFTQTLHDDLTWVTEVGGGVRVALGRAPSGPALDLGVRAMRNGVASYVTGGGVTQNGDGSYTVRPIRSEANLLLINLGLSATLP